MTTGYLVTNTCERIDVALFCLPPFSYNEFGGRVSSSTAAMFGSRLVIVRVSTPNDGVTEVRYESIAILVDKDVPLLFVR